MHPPRFAILAKKILVAKVTIGKHLSKKPPKPKNHPLAFAYHSLSNEVIPP